MISTNANQEIPPNLFHDSNPIEAPYSYAEQFSHTGLILQKYLQAQNSTVSMTESKKCSVTNF